MTERRLRLSRSVLSCNLVVPEDRPDQTFQYSDLYLRGSPPTLKRTVIPNQCVSLPFFLAAIRPNGDRQAGPEREPAFRDRLPGDTIT